MVPQSLVFDNENILFQSTPFRTTYQRNEKKPFLSEWKLAIIGLTISVLVLATKLYSANSEYLKQILIEPRLATYETITEDGQVMFTHVWTSFVKYSNIWLPLLCGGLTTYFTWMMVYLDSHVPGVQPPSPFSPSKYKTSSGHTFHLNYIFAVLVGILITINMYWRQVTIQY